jgi:ribonucleoside-triphosphate reductase
MTKCTEKTEVYSRIVGYYRPVQQWNVGKREEYNGRTVYAMPDIAEIETTDVPDISEMEHK